MRAAVYLRISLDKTGEGAGVDRQLTECRGLIARRDWTLAPAHVFSDNSISAAGKRNRPAFQKMLDAIRRHEVDVVVAWAFDRLSRNRRDEVALIEACKEAGVSIALVRGAGDLDLSSAIGRAIAEMMATMGRMEIEQKGERHQSHLAAHRAEGKPWGPINAFGYAPDRVTIVEAEADLIRKAYVDVIAGASCRGIAATWNAAGVRTHVHLPKSGKVSLRKGKRWSGAAVKRVLVNPRYAGIRATSVGTPGRRELIEVGRAAWDGIVDEATWRDAHAELTKPERASTTVRVRRHLLPAIAVCGRCRAPMRSYITGRGVQSYQCSAAPHMRRKAEPLELMVTEAALARLEREDAQELLVDDTRANVAELRDAANAIRSRMKATRARFRQSTAMTPDDLAELLEGMAADLAAVEEQMAEPTRSAALAEIVKAADPRALWAELDLDRRRAIIAALMVVRVHPQRPGPGFDPDAVELDWLI